MVEKKGSHFSCLTDNVQEFTFISEWCIWTASLFMFSESEALFLLLRECVCMMRVGVGDTGVYGQECRRLSQWVIFCIIIFNLCYGISILTIYIINLNVCWLSDRNSTFHDSHEQFNRCTMRCSSSIRPFIFDLINFFFGLPFLSFEFYFVFFMISSRSTKSTEMHHLGDWVQRKVCRKFSV